MPPDARGHQDPTPDVTVNNQDVPGQMNQPQPDYGMHPNMGQRTGVILSEPPSMGGSPVYEEAEPHVSGLAPDDRAGDFEQFAGSSPTPLDTADLDFPLFGRPQFDTENGDAVPVFQRAAHDWTSGALALNNNSQEGPVQIVGRQKGRLSTTLWVPAKDANGNVPNGVTFASTEGELQNAGYPAVLNVGDSVTINSEAAVWCAVISGNTTGLVCFKTEYNPAGGELGGY